MHHDHREGHRSNRESHQGTRDRESHQGTREIQLAAALVEAADTLSDGFDAGLYLQRLSDHCVALLGARAAGIMLIEGGETVSFAVSGRHADVAHDLLEAQSHGGPCLDTYVSGKPVPPVSLRDAHTAARWPDFTERALSHDVTATLAVPLLRGERALGALNVFVPALPEPPSPQAEFALHLAQLIADAAAIGLANHRAHSEYRTLAAQLQQALSSRVRIEQAKGMLAERWRTGVNEAFTAMRQYARRHRLPLDLVATAVVEDRPEAAPLRDRPSDVP
ncbi:GAF and ANTAR domain-containing protein [Streptomyces spongiae]|uniref:GAF and ANTAR domain-containing protein n=1 Tax=Streptomyces spongiae TaxID=565072 RepID=A0A5N8XE39_9ACTN|nr:ANTAR domain-containing protein [Streptomyces spongiae]MPY57783.1 GAF and ANTAR domain-containing protein [Streptomyces spongiae]